MVSSIKVNFNPPLPLDEDLKDYWINTSDNGSTMDKVKAIFKYIIKFFIYLFVPSKSIKYLNYTYYDGKSITISFTKSAEKTHKINMNHIRILSYKLKNDPKEMANDPQLGKIFNSIGACELLYNVLIQQKEKESNTSTRSFSERMEHQVNEVILQSFCLQLVAQMDYLNKSI